MSVTCVIYGASDREIAALLESPPSIHRFLGDAIRVERPGCIAAFFGGRPKRLPPTRPVYDLGKSWEAVHYVLNGTKGEVALPKGFITSGGAEIGDEDVGYGPARALTAPSVKKIAEALDQVTVAEFRKRIDGKKMRPLHVYGAPPSDNPEDAEYLVNDFDGLRAFLSERAREGAGIVIQYV